MVILTKKQININSLSNQIQSSTISIKEFEFNEETQRVGKYNINIDFKSTKKKSTECRDNELYLDELKCKIQNSDSINNQKLKEQKNSYKQSLRELKTSHQQAMLSLSMQLNKEQKTAHNLRKQLEKIIKQC